MPAVARTPKPTILQELILEFALDVAFPLCLAAETAVCVGMAKDIDADDTKTDGAVLGLCPGVPIILCEVGFTRLALAADEVDEVELLDDFTPALEDDTIVNIGAFSDEDSAVVISPGWFPRKPKGFSKSLSPARGFCDRLVLCVRGTELEKRGVGKLESKRAEGTPFSAAAVDKETAPADPSQDTSNTVRNSL